MSLDPHPGDAALLEKYLQQQGQKTTASPSVTKGPRALDCGERKPREKDVEAAADRLMVALGYTQVRFSQARATMQSPGIPDRKYYKGSHTFWYECKRPGGKQSPFQKAFQLMAEAAGEEYVVGNLDALEAYLRGRGTLPK